MPRKAESFLQRHEPQTSVAIVQFSSHGKPESPKQIVLKARRKALTCEASAHGARRFDVSHKYQEKTASLVLNRCCR